MGSKRVWQLKHTARTRARAVHARGRGVHAHKCTPVGSVRAREPQEKLPAKTRAALKRVMRVGADERALFTIKMADYARRHASVRAFTRVCQAE